MDHGEFAGLSAEQHQHESRGQGKPSENDEGLFAQMQLKPMTPEQLFDSLLTATQGPPRRLEVTKTTRSATPGSGSSSSRSPTMKPRNRPTFQGTIPQALMMMNGEMMQEALSGKPGSFLGEVMRASRATEGRPKRSWLIRSIWPPSAAIPRQRGQPRRGDTSVRFPDSLQVLQDLFWALLNSNEFVLVH